MNIKRVKQVSLSQRLIVSVREIIFKLFHQTARNYLWSIFWALDARRVQSIVSVWLRTGVSTSSLGLCFSVAFESLCRVPLALEGWDDRQTWAAKKVLRPRKYGARIVGLNGTVGSSRWWASIITVPNSVLSQA